MPFVFTAPMLFAACGGDEPAKPDTVQKRIDQNLPELMDQVMSSSAFLNDSQEWTDLMSSLSALTSLSGLSAEDDLAPTPAADEDDLDGQAIAQFLIDNIFNDDNYEGDGVYRVPSALICPDGIDPETGLNIDNSECIAQLDAIEVRIGVEVAGDGLDFDLLIGPDRDAPLSLELRSDRLSTVADLAEARSAMLHVATVMGESLELPDTMEGVVAASILLNAPMDVSFELAIREDVDIAGTFPDVGSVQLSTAAADPIFSLRLNGADQELTASYDLGPTTFSIPWQSINAESLATGIFALDWKGSSASVFLQSGTPGIEVTDIGLGDGTSTIKLDDETLFAVDLNPSSGRRFDVAITPVAGGLPTMTISPELDLTVDCDLGVLADAGDDVPAHLIDQTYSVQITGPTPTLQAVENIDTSALKVVSGELRIASSAVVDPIVVASGQCLLADEVMDGEHPLLGALASGNCP